MRLITIIKTLLTTSVMMKYWVVSRIISTDVTVIFCVLVDGGSSNVGRGCLRSDGMFAPDRRWLVYSALIIMWFYWTVRRCTSLVGDWSCGDAVSCSSNVEWIVSTAGAAQAMVSVAMAAAHRQASTAHLLNNAYNVLSRSTNKRMTGGGILRRQHAFTMAAVYATVAGSVVLARSVAVIIARPDRFAIADVLLLCLPAVTVTVVVECVIVCICVTAEDTCRDVVHRLHKIALDAARPPVADRRGGHRPLHWQLEAAWRDHWRGCQLVDGLSTCYGLDLAVNLTASMLYFVVYAYVTLISVYASFDSLDHGNTIEHNNSASIIYWNIALACQLFCVSFRIVFISYRAERIKQVVSGIFRSNFIPQSHYFASIQYIVRF